MKVKFGAYVQYSLFNSNNKVREVDVFFKATADATPEELKARAFAATRRKRRAKECWLLQTWLVQDS